MVKSLPADAGDIKRPRINPWVGKIPWRRTWQPTPVFWLGKSHRQRSLGGHSPWGCKVKHDLATKPEKAMAPHSSTLAWRIPGTGEPGGLPSIGSHRVRHD